MILRELASVLAQQKSMSSRELAKHFQASEDVVDAMLGVWMKKGRVRKLVAGGCSGSCCGQRTEAYYEWLPEGQIGVVCREA